VLVAGALVQRRAAHLGEQVSDDGMGRGGDPDSLALVEQLTDQPGADVRLAAARRALHRQHRAGHAGGNPHDRVGRAFAGSQLGARHYPVEQGEGQGSSTGKQIFARRSDRLAEHPVIGRLGRPKSA